MSQSVQAFITKDYRLGSFNKKDLFLIVLKVGKSKTPQIHCLVMSCRLAVFSHSGKRTREFLRPLL